MRRPANPRWTRLEKRWALRLGLVELDSDLEGELRLRWTLVEAQWALRNRLVEAAEELAA